MLKAVIFDMDGLLIDSEPFWQEAAAAVFKKVDLHLNSEMFQKTIGLRVDEVVEYWFDRHPWDEEVLSRQEIRDEIVERVIALIRSRGEANVGVAHILEFFQSRPVRLALASSSDMRIIEAVLEKLGLQDTFEVIHSAEYESYGKPHPAVYLSTAQRLDVPPERCLAFEDSINGLLSAKSARMKCVAVPEASLKNDRRWGMAEVVLNSLADFREEIWQQLNGTQ